MRNSSSQDLHQNNSLASHSCGASVPHTLTGTEIATRSSARLSKLRAKSVVDEYWMSSLHYSGSHIKFIVKAMKKKNVKPNTLHSIAFALEICTARSMITSRTRKNRPKMDKIFIMVLVPRLFDSNDAKHSCACLRRIHYGVICLALFFFVSRLKCTWNYIKISLHICFVYRRLNETHSSASPMSHTTHANRQTDNFHKHFVNRRLSLIRRILWHTFRTECLEKLQHMFEITSWLRNHIMANHITDEFPRKIT